MYKFYVFRFYVEKKFLLQEMVRLAPLYPPTLSPFSTALCYERIMNICFSSKFALRIPSLLSSFVPLCDLLYHRYFPEIFFLLYQNENLF